MDRQLTTEKRALDTIYNFNNGLLLEILPIKPKKTLGDRSFQMAAPAVWNNLPINIRNKTNFYIYIY